MSNNETMYTVTVSSEFLAEDPRDALQQMASLLETRSWELGYRITASDGTNVFLDAEYEGASWDS
jgi:hypothetical protein